MTIIYSLITYNIKLNNDKVYKPETYFKIYKFTPITGIIYKTYGNKNHTSFYMSTFHLKG